MGAPSSDLYLKAYGVGMKTGAVAFLDSAFNMAMSYAKLKREKKKEQFGRDMQIKELEYKRDKMKQELAVHEADTQRQQSQFDVKAGQTEKYISQAGQRIEGQGKRDIVSAAGTQSLIAKRGESSEDRAEYKKLENEFNKRSKTLWKESGKNPVVFYDLLVGEFGGNSKYQPFVEKFEPKGKATSKSNNYSRISGKASMVAARKVASGMDKRDREDMLEKSGLNLSAYIKGLADELDIRRQKVMDELRGGSGITQEKLEELLKKAAVADADELLWFEQKVGLESNFNFFDPTTWFKGE